MASNISEKVGTSRKGVSGLCLPFQALGTHPTEPGQHLHVDAPYRKIEKLGLLQGNKIRNCLILRKTQHIQRTQRYRGLRITVWRRTPSVDQTATSYDVG